MDMMDKSEKEYWFKLGQKSKEYQRNYFSSFVFWVGLILGLFIGVLISFVF